MLISFDNPRRWLIRLYGPMNVEGTRYRRHLNLGVVASNAEKAIKRVEQDYPDWRLESCADTGEINFIVE